MVDSVDRDLLRRLLAAGRLSRRDFVKRVAVGLSIPAVASLAAACGGDDDDDDGGETPATPTTAGAAQPTNTSVTVNQNVTPTPTTASTAASPTAAAPTATSAPQVTRGGSINVLRSIDTDFFDPVVTDANAAIWIFMNIYDQLIKVDDTGTGLKPGLALSWEVSEDGITHTFKIRQRVKFSDGTDMTMDDIIWSLDRARTTETSPWVWSLAQVKKMEAADDETFVITLSEKWAPFLSDLSLFNASIISRAFAEKIGVENLVDQCMGTGPFYLKEWKKSEYVLLGRNEHYYEEGLPLLDEVKITEVPDTNSQVLQVQGGDVDGIVGQGDVPLNRVAELEKDSNLVVYKWPSTWNNYVVMNITNPPLNDVHARRALNYATDTLALIDTVLFGIGEFSNSFMPKGALYWNPDQPGYPYDLDKAMEELKQSATPDGFEVEMQINAGNAQQSQIATAIKDMWSKINVTLNIAQLDSEVSRQNYREEKFQVRLSGWTNDIIDPDELVSYAILPDATNNYHTNWHNQEAIDLALQARGELDPEKRRQLYYEIQRIHMEDAPFIYLYVIPYVDVLRANVKGFFHHPMGQYVFLNTYKEE